MQEVEKEMPFDAETIILTAEQNGLDRALIDFIERSFADAATEELLKEIDLPMPDAFKLNGFGAVLEWYVEGTAYEIDFINFQDEQRIDRGSYDISSGAYDKAVFPAEAKSLVEIITFIQEKITKSVKYRYRCKNCDESIILSNMLDWLTSEAEKTARKEFDKIHREHFTDVREVREK